MRGPSSALGPRFARKVNIQILIKAHSRLDKPASRDRIISTQQAEGGLFLRFDSLVQGLSEYGVLHIESMQCSK